MADRFSLTGSYCTIPLAGNTSFIPSVEASIVENIQLLKKKVDTVDLDIDTPISIGLGGLDSAHIVILKSVSGASVTARITSAVGIQQSIPFDTYMFILTMDNPVTALDLIRTPATDTEVNIFLGQASV